MAEAVGRTGALATPQGEMRRIAGTLPFPPCPSPTRTITHDEGATLMTAWLATGGAMGATGIEAAEIGDDGLAATGHTL